MVKFDLQKIEDLAVIGVLLSKGINPIQGSNYITTDGTREHYAFYSDEVKHFLNGITDTEEYKVAYLTALFTVEARKQVPLVQHKLHNDTEVLIPANLKKNEVIEILNKL